MLKIGIIGTGNMGKNHVRVISELTNEYFLEGFYDPSPDNVKYIKEVFGIKSYETIEDLLQNVDVVTVAAPSSLHGEIGRKIVSTKKHALIEKPITLEVSDGEELEKEFDKNKKVLMVGHIERFNPVVLALKQVLKNEEIIAIEARRFSPYDPRISDTNVIFDLMIHDIDIVCNFLNRNKISNIFATGTNVYSEKNLDYVSATINHDNKTITTIISSRITEDKIREIDIHTKKSFIVADLLNKKLTIFRKTNIKLNVGYEIEYKQETIVEKIMVPNVEPLKAEYLELYRAIKEKDQPTTCSNDAINALMIASKINNIANNN